NGVGTWQNLPQVGTGFAYYAGATTTCPNSTFTALSFATKEFDDGTPTPNFNGTIYTAPSSGVYQFNAAVTFTPTIAAGNIVIYIIKNGSNWKTVDVPCVSTSIPISATISSILQLSAGQTVEIKVLQNTGASLNCVANQLATWFSGSRIY
ncbi:MAG TPA: hypothetical protein VK806_00820, partial [Bacteroidia bacterium]|nr:hypothetical protein [Bacteroidia bacterium]